MNEEDIESLYAEKLNISDIIDSNTIEDLSIPYPGGHYQAFGVKTSALSTISFIKTKPMVSR